LGGRIDILVNNVGIYPGGSTTATDEKTFDRVYAVNVKAPFFLTAAIALPGPTPKWRGGPARQPARTRGPDQRCAVIAC
jgi:NAD(P)-dependent dehydrogenase (short-subunit alcohol dehydrogenase family)